MRSPLSHLAFSMLVATLAGPVRGQEAGAGLAVRVSRRAPVFAHAAEDAPTLGFIQAGQVYVLPAPTPSGAAARERICFSDRAGWVERAALEPLLAQPLYRVAAAPGLRVGDLGRLPDGALVAPIERQRGLALIHFAGQAAWIPASALRGPLAPRGAGPRAEAGGGGLTGALARTAGGEAAPSEPVAGARPSGAGRVDYQGHTVSSAGVRALLQRLADLTGRTVRVTSGDRRHVPRGGSRTSLHLHGRAADFAVDGQPLEQTFELIRARRQELFAGGAFEVIWHQASTHTSGPHLHAGQFDDGRASELEVEARGVYRRVP